jgi:hypothetical protein
MDFRLNLGYTGKFHLGKTLVGHLTMMDYQNSHLITENFRYRYTPNKLASKLDTVFRATDNAYTNEVRVGGIHNWTVAINNRNKVEFKNLFNMIAKDNTTLRTEFQFDGRDSPKRLWSAYNFQYERRLIYSGQLAGTHYISSSTQLKWAGGYGFTIREEPNTRRFRQYREPATIIYLPKMDFLGAVSRTDSLQNYRNASQFYSNLREEVLTGSLHLDQVLNPLADDNKQIKLSVGAFIEQKNRSFDARLFAYEPTGYINYQNRSIYQRNRDSLSWPDPFVGVLNDSLGLVVNEKTSPTDQYTASNNLLAGFASLYYPVTTRLSVRAGLRYENNVQSVTLTTMNISTPLGSPLPSLHLTYDFSDQVLFRFAYNGSVIRPALGELAPFQGYDFQFDAFRKGNINLQTTKVQNFDARVELYPTRYDIVTIGGFFKQFDQPIELVMDTSAYVSQMMFVNAKSATQFGVEIEFRRNFKSIFKDPFLKCLALGGNITFTRSNVTITEEQKNAGLDNDRPLLGHSPYSVNLGVYYINPKQKTQANIMYNIIGPRVWAVGNYMHPTIYEMSRHVLNFNISKEIGRHFEARLTINDLLNMPYRFVQDDTRAGNPSYNSGIISNYRKGTYVTLGVLFKL